MVFHWERTQGLLFIIQQATSHNSLCPGLVPSILTKQTNTCPKAYTQIYYLYNCISYALLQSITSSPTHRCNSTETTLLPNLFFTCGVLPVGFYLCNQGFQRQEASLEGSVMERGSVCPAAWNTKCIEVNSGKQQKRILGGQGKPAACKRRSGLKSMWGSAVKPFDKLISAEQLRAQRSWESWLLTKGPKQKLLGRTSKKS